MNIFLLARTSFIKRITQSENTYEKFSMANSNMVSKKLDHQT